RGPPPPRLQQLELRYPGLHYRPPRPQKGAGVLANALGAENIVERIGGRLAVADGEEHSVYACEHGRLLCDFGLPPAAAWGCIIQCTRSQTRRRRGVYSLTRAC